MIEFMEGHAIRVIVTMILAKNEEVSSPKVGFKNAGPVPNDSAGFQVMVGKTGEPGRDAVGWWELCPERNLRDDLGEIGITLSRFDGLTPRQFCKARLFFCSGSSVLGFTS